MALAQYNFTTQDYASGASGSFAFDVGSGANRTLGALIRWKDDVTAYATDCNLPTYNSVNLAVGRKTIFEPFSNTWYGACVYYLDNPASGSNTFAWSLNADASDGVSVALLAVTGANNGIGANTGTATGNDTNPTCTFTTGDANSWIFGGAVHGGPANPFAPDGTETELDDGSVGVIAYFCFRDSASGGSDTVGETGDASNRWAISAIEIQEAAAGDLSVTISDTSAYQFTGVRVVG
jgi:hypothetical protein